MAEANAYYEPSKKNAADHLKFYKGEKIRVYGKYLTPPFNKFWIGEVAGVKVSATDGAPTVSIMNYVNILLQVRLMALGAVGVLLVAFPPCVQRGIGANGSMRKALQVHPDLLLCSIDLMVVLLA